MLTNLLPPKGAEGDLRRVQLYRWDLFECINAWHAAKDLDQISVRLWAVATRGIQDEIAFTLNNLGGLAGEW
ncbi:MAG: hypothetical protein JNL99_01905 [Zoogloea sp.]|nr:hypothetical protein [Zoogloea sp.]